MPVRELSDDEARELTFGRAIATAGVTGTYAVIAPDGTVSALLCEDADRARPVLVFTAAG